MECILYIETKYSRKIFFKKKKRLPQDCGTKRMKHNSVAKLPRLALQLILLLPSSSETRLLREMVQQKRKKKKEGKKSYFLNIHESFNCRTIRIYIFAFLCTPSFVHPVATNRIIYRHKSIHAYIYTYTYIYTYISTVKIYS